MTLLTAISGSCPVSRGEEPAPAPAAPPGDAVESRPAPTEDDLAAWIVELDHPRFAVREQATAALIEAGPAAAAPLAAALNGKSLEAADRAVGILEGFAKSGDTPLRLVALEALVKANRFPAAAQRAESELAVLYEELCQERFESLGADFQISHQLVGALGMVTRVRITVDPEKWEGSVQDFQQLQRLRRLYELKISAPMIDDQAAMRLGSIHGLKQLELIQTQASLAVVEQLREDRPGLRVILRSRSKLGVGFGLGGGLVVSQVIAGSPAERAGFMIGDQVQAFDGKEVDHFDALTAHIAQHQPGENVNITVLRGQEIVIMTAELGEGDWITEGSD